MTSASLSAVDESPRSVQDPPTLLLDEEDGSSGVLERLIGLSRSQAWDLVGGLSNPSKMPCYSWGIPAYSCLTGTRLAGIDGSVCRACYALKGYYRTHRVRKAYERRLARFEGPRWVEAMVKLVYWQTAETGVPFFRWFDSGDLQSVEMLHKIVQVAIGTPEIRHWLPTREYGIVEEFIQHHGLPPNIVIRLSAHMVDSRAPRRLGLTTSTVHSTADAGEGVLCPAYSTRQPFCGGCRACWDPSVGNVSYPLH